MTGIEGLEFQPEIISSLGRLVELREKQIRAIQSREYLLLAQLFEQEAELTSNEKERDWLYFRAGEIYLNENEEKAEELFEKITPSSEWKRLSLIVLANRALAQRDFSKLAEIYKERAELEDKRAGWAFSLLYARILAFRLGKRKEAEEVLAKILESAPDFVPALLTLIQIQLEAGDWKKLVECYQKLVELAEEKGEGELVKSYSYRIACLMEGRIGSPLSALEWYNRLAESDCAIYGLLCALEILEALRQEKELRQNLDLLVQALPEQESWFRSLLLFRLSRFYDLEQNREKELSFLNQVVELDPSNLLAWWRIEALAREEKNYVLLAKSLRALADLIDDEELKFYYLTELAQVMLDFLEDFNSCQEVIKEAEEINPDSLAIVRLKQSLAFRKSDWQAFEQAIDKELSLTEDSRELQALLILKAEAELYGKAELEQAEKSYMQALEVPASQFPLLRSLEQILLQTRSYENYLKITLAMEKLVNPEENRSYYLWRRALVAELALDKIELAVGAWSDLIRLKPEFLPALFALSRILRSKRARDNYLRAQERILSLTEKRSFYSHLLYQTAWDFERIFGEGERADELWERFYKSDSSQPVLLDARRWLAYRARAWQELVELWRKLGERVVTSQLRSAWHLRLGFYLESFLGEPKQARASYERALQENAIALIYPAIIELSYFQSDWESASALLREFSRQLKDEFQAGFRWHSAMLLWEKLAEPSERIQQDLQDAFERTRDSFYRAVLSEFYRTAGFYDQLAGLLEEQISEAEEDFAPWLELEYAHLLYRKMGLHSQAIEEYLRALSEYPEYMPLIRELEIIALEKDHSRLLAEVLVKEISLRTNPDLLTFLYHWLAQVYERKLNDPEQAIASLRSLLKIRPDWLFGLEELHRLYKNTENFKELVVVINSEIALNEEKARKIELYLEGAEVFDQKLSQPEQAIEALLGARSLDPENLEIFSRLKELYLKLERWNELVRLIEDEIKLTADERRRAELFIQAGEIYEEKLGEPERAISSYQEAERILPEDERVLSALERLYTGEERWQELIGILEKLFVLRSASSERVELANRIGRIYADKLGDIDSAISSYLRSLEIEPDNIPALSALVELYEKKGESEKQVKTIIRLAEAKSHTAPQQAVDLYLKAGEIYEQVFTDEKKALELYDKASGLAPRDLRPLDKKQKIFERNQSWQELAELLERKAELVESDDERKQIFTSIAQLYQSRLSLEDKAIEFYSRALALDGEYLPAVKPLAEIYYHRGSWQEAERLYQIWSRYLSDEPLERRAEILYHFGVVEEHLGKEPDALNYYQASSQLKPHYLEPLRRLFALNLKRGDKLSAENFGRELVLALEEQGEREELFEVLSKMGELEAGLEKTEPAIDYLERALVIKPNHYPSLRLLVDLYKAKENWAKTLASYDRLIKSSTSPELIAQGLVEKGEVLEEKVGERESAIAHYQKAVEVKPDYLWGWRRLAEALIKEKKWREAERAYRRIVELESEPEKKVEDYYQLGLIYRDGFGDLDRAREAFESALKINKTHIPSIEAILSLYLKQKQWDKYIEMSQQFLNLIPREEAKKSIPIHYQRAQVYRDFIEDRERAINEFKSILQLDSEHLKARIELAELYAKDSRKEYQLLAIREHQAILDRDLFRLESYHQMGQLYELQGRLDEALCCYLALELFGATNSDENMFLDAHRSQIPRSSGKSLAPDIHHRLLVHPSARGVLLELVSDIGDYLAELFPSQLDKFGASKSKKVPASSNVGIKKLTDEIARNLGLDSYELYLVSTVNEPKLACTNPPSLIVNPDWLNRFSGAERRFILGRWLELARLRAGLILNNPIQEVLRAVLLFAWLLAPEIKVPGVGEDEIEKRAKPVKRAVPRKVRAQMEDKAKALAREGLPRDLNLWQKGIILTANRAGMLVCGDLKSSLSACLKLNPKFKNINFAELADPRPVIEQSEEARDLLRFWLSEHFFTLRKRAGYSLLSS